MMAKGYVKFQTPKDLSDKLLQLVEMAKNSGKIRKGLNESTKAIERSIAQLVIVAEDVEPEEIVMHIPPLCEEKNIPYAFVPSKLELGRAAGIEVGSAAISITDAGDGKDLIKEVLKRLKEIGK
jgi:large subunit ribosomal protein L7Ae